MMDTYACNPRRASHSCALSSLEQLASDYVSAMSFQLDHGVFVYKVAEQIFWAWCAAIVAQTCLAHTGHHGALGGHSNR